MAGLGDKAQVDPDLLEWNYGAYEGLTTAQIHEQAPGWMLFHDGCPGGEKPEEVGGRADRVIAKVRATDGHVALFAHGHVLRVLAARWLGLSASGGQHFLLDTATVSVFGYYRGGSGGQRVECTCGSLNAAFSALDRLVWETVGFWKMSLLRSRWLLFVCKEVQLCRVARLH